MNSKEDFAALVFTLLATILLGTLAIFASAFIVQLGWNWSMPQLFGLPEASFRSAIGLSLLAWAVRLSVKVSKE
jgi:hypothetical protein